MDINVFGLNHETAPVTIRETVAFDEKTLRLLYEKLSPSISNLLILSTCNRMEFYYTSSKSCDRHYRLIVSMIENISHSARLFLLPDVTYRYKGKEAICHLFRVGAGLDSLVIGENQILGQLKKAYQMATEYESLQTEFHKLFHSAFRVAKRVRSLTKLTEGVASVGGAAVELAIQHFHSIEDKKILLVGAGDAATSVLKHLMTRNAKHVTIINRTYERAMDLATTLGGVAKSFTELESEIKLSDIIIASTTSKGPWIDSYMIGRVSHDRLFLDIAVPRNIDPGIHRQGVILYGMDDFTSAMEEGLQKRKEEEPQAMEIINREIRSFSQWFESSKHDSLIREFCQKFDHIRLTELEKNRKRYTEAEYEKIDVFSKSLIKKLIHSPLIRLREEKKFSSDESIRTIRDLFQLQPEESL